MPVITVADFPEIAAQWDAGNGELTPDRVASGSKAKVWWVCARGHRWQASPANRTRNGSGCGVCAGKVVVAGVNDFATACPDLVASWASDLNALAPTQVTAGSNKAVWWRCAQGHVWKAKVSHRADGSGCPVCAGRKPGPLALTHPDLAAELDDETADAHHLTAGSGRKVWWRCAQGHRFEAVVNYRARKAGGCPVCSLRAVVPGTNDLATTHPDLAAQLVGADPASVTALSTRTFEWVCVRSHRWTASVNARARGRGCPVCAGRNSVLATTHPELTAQLCDPELASQLSAGSHRAVQWRCEQGHVWTARVDSRVRGAGCPGSPLSGEVRACLSGLGVPVSASGDWLSCPRQRLVIELCPVGAERAMAAVPDGWRTVRVQEDDWNRRRSVVVRMLAAQLGVTERLGAVLPASESWCWERVGARSLSVVEVSPSDARTFWDANHLQGAVGTSRRFGLVDAAGRLRALLGLRAPASGRHRRAPGEWDIVRYATAGIVPGGFTKLLAHASKTLLAEGHELSAWVTFADLDRSQGDLYTRTGFAEVARLRPDYRYVGPATSGRLVSKESFQLARFRTDPRLRFEEGWTESRAARENGLARVWGVGKVKYRKPVQN